MMQALKDPREIPKTDSPGEVKLHKDLYRVAAEEYGMTLSDWLEHANPSKPGDDLTAFERQLARFGIKVKSDSKKALNSSPMYQFFVTDDSRILFPEYINNVVRWEILSPDDDPYDINYLVASKEGLNDNIIRELYISDEEDDYEEGQSSEMGSFHEIEIGWADYAENMKKYGIAIKWSYEFLRRTKLEMIKPVIERFAGVQRRNIFKEGLYYLINGTGRDKTPAASSTAASAYDTSISANGQLTEKAWLKWLNSCRPYSIDRVFMRFDTWYILRNVTRADINTLAFNQSPDGKIEYQPSLVRGLKANPEVIIVDDAMISENTILGIDSRYAAQYLWEIGSDLKEIERVITQQFERMVLSHYSGFGKIFPRASKVLTLTGF